MIDVQRRHAKMLVEAHLKDHGRANDRLFRGRSCRHICCLHVPLGQPVQSRLADLGVDRNHHE